MGDIFKGSVNFGDLLNDIKAEVNKLKDAGEEAGEAIGVGFDDGFSDTIQTIKASSIKLSGQFNNLRSSITKQVQQLSTIANGKKIKLKINFADIDMNSDRIKDRIRSILDDFSESGAVEFDAKGSQQQFENLISLYVKYAEKLDKLRGEMDGFSASSTSPDKLVKNLQEQLVLAQEINKIVSFLQNQTNLNVPMYGQDFVIRNSKKYLDLLSKIKQETNDINDNKSGQAINGDFSGIADKLEEIRKSIEGVTNAFKPLTDALASEDSALGAMVKANIADLNALNQKVEETFKNIETLSKKEFNVTQNFTSAGSAKGSGSVEEMRNQARQIYESIDLINSAISNAFSSNKNLYKDVGSYFHVFSENLVNFSEDDYGEKITSVKTAKTLEKYIANLTIYKDKFMSVINEINKVKPGAIDLSKIFADLTGHGGAKTDFTIDQAEMSLEETLAKVKLIYNQIATEFSQIEEKLQNVFDFSKLNPDYSYIDTIVDNIYQRFVELQSKINALDLKLDMPAIVAKVDGNGGATQGVTESPHYVTDPQGKVVEMYRGVHDSYGGLLSNREDNITFFSDNIELAKQYSGELGKIEKVFLSMKNPFEIDGKGKSWAGIQYLGDGSDEASQKLIKLRQELDRLEDQYKSLTSNESLSDELQQIADQTLKKIHEIETKMSEVFKDLSNPYGYYSTDELAKMAKQKGHDGVIFKNILDGDNTKLSNVMAVFAQDQIHYLETIQSSADAVNDEAKSFKDVEDTADAAASAKEKFANANKQVAKTAEETSDKVKEEAKQMKEAAGAIVEASDKFDKIQYVTDADGNPRSKITTSTTTREKAIETESQYYTYKDGEEELQAISIVKNFKKRAAELKKEADKIALAQKTVDKFLSQFESKTAGQANAIKGFAGKDGLKGFTIENLDDIEKATQKMIDLDNEYNKITKDFRQGTKSMNPFVNAITGIDEMENKILEAEIAFNGLNNKPDELNSEIASLTPLLAKMKSYIAEDENGEKKILDIYGLAKAYGELNSALRQVNSNISIQRKFDQWDAKDTNFGLDLEKQLSGLVKQQAQWDKNGQLTDELRLKIEQMFDSLLAVTNSAELTAWKKQWSIVKDEVMATKYAIEATKKAEGAVAKKEAEDKAYWDKEFQRSLKELTDDKKRPELEQIKAYMLQQAAATKENVVEQYDAIMTIVVNKNNALKKLMSAQGSEEQAYWSKEYSAWFGAWNALDPDAISAFFADAGNQAMLGADKVNKFNAAVEESKVLSARQADAQTKQDNDNLEHAIKLQNQLYDLKKKLAKVDAGSARGQELTRQIKDKQEEYDAAEKLLKTEEASLKLAEKRVQLEKELAATQRQAQNSFGKSIFNAESKQYDKIEAQERTAESLKLELSPDFTAKLNEYKAAFKELSDLRDKFVNDPNAAGDTALEQQFADAAVKAEGLRKEVLATFKEVQKFKQLSDSGNLLGSQTFDPADLENAKAAMIEYGAAITNGKLKFEGFNDACTEMYGTLDNGAGSVQKVTIAMLKGTNTLYAYRDGTKQVSNSWQTLGNDLANGVKRLASMYLGFHEAIQAVRQGLTYVKEIDLALTELKKVTDETDETYNKFLTTASEVSAVIGSTVSDFTDATAAFARLGYSIDESSKMAETAIVYKNVADGLDTVEESTESIISTMMAYGIEANNTMGIIDRFNAVGKLYCPVM